MLKKLTISCIALLVASCQTGSSYRPIVRNPGPNYQTDLAECQEFSKQKKYFNGDTGTNAAATAAVGGIAGAFLGGRDGALAGAAAGGALGAGGGLMQAKEEKKYIIMRCLTEKGYNVYI